MTHVISAALEAIGNAVVSGLIGVIPKTQPWRGIVIGVYLLILAGLGTLLVLSLIEADQGVRTYG